MQPDEKGDQGNQELSQSVEFSAHPGLPSLAAKRWAI
jgi:hypothetical protein